MSDDRKMLRSENSFSTKQHSMKNSSIQEMYSNKADDDTAVVKQVNLSKEKKSKKERLD